MHITQQVINYLIETAIKEGKKEAHKWVIKQLKKHGNDAMKVAEDLGMQATKSFHRFMEKQHGHKANEKHEKQRGIGPMNCGWSAEHDIKKCPPSKHNPALSQSNLPTTTQMTGHKRDLDTHEEQNMGTAPEEGGEQQVTRPHKVWRRFPNTETAALKWVQSTFANGGSYPPNNPFDNNNYHTATSLLTGGGGAIDSLKTNSILNTTTGTDYNIPQLFQLRMTSPYNILKSYTTLNNNIGNSQPMWLELFDSKYQYYHVMETEWEITFHFGKPNNGTNTTTNYIDYGLYIFWRYTNEDDPPIQWTANTNNVANTQGVAFTTANGDTITTTEMTNAIGGGTVNLTADDYMRMGGWHHKRVHFNNTHSEVYTLEGKYRYGQCKMDIKTLTTSDAHSAATTAEGWGQVGSTPAFPEILSIIVVADNATNNGGGITVPTGIRFETEQLIQFKDLRTVYKFPTPGICKVAPAGSLNTDAAFFWKGGAYT